MEVAPHAGAWIETSAVQRAISGSASADNSGSLLAELKKLLTIQEKGWRVIEKLGVA